MNQPLSRRSVLGGSAAVAAAGFFGFSAKSYGNIVGSNDAIRMGVIGFNGRGNSHIDAYMKMKGVRIVALCDADAAVLAKGLARVERGDVKPTKGPSTRPTTKPMAQNVRKGQKGVDDAVLASASDAAADDRNALTGGPATMPTTKPATKVTPYADLRKLLDNKDIDAISTATPNHWHALISIWACQAGKDVYVEKPVSHNVSEGRRIVEAARKYDRIVQAGMQARSNMALKAAYAWVQAGNLGKIKVSRGLCYKRRGTIGKTTGDQPIPKSVDYELWTGPAAMQPLHREKLHYEWHWQWNCGNGDLGNQGIHQMDTARWALGKEGLSPKVLSVGGRFGYEDDGHTPNTQMVVHDYGDSMLIFEVRGLPKADQTGGMDKLLGIDIGTIVECENGYMVDTGYTSEPKVYDWDGKFVRKFAREKSEDTVDGINDGNGGHFVNFVKALRSRKREDQNGEILEGHLSSALCHTGNISYQLGQKVKPREIREALKGNKAGLETFGRLRDHLEDNGVSILGDQAVLGASLEMDPKTERFTGDNAEKANALLTREYRKGFEVPASV
ncbi:MAG: oxidoreductase domain protein [Phycisphaerales bacterium]|nr:oxidoreductase domain protein [Phycisphaerales bacterium]